MQKRFTSLEGWVWDRPAEVGLAGLRGNPTAWSLPAAALSQLSVWASPVFCTPWRTDRRSPPWGWVLAELVSGVPPAATSARSGPFLEARPEGPVRRGCGERRRPDGPQQASRGPGCAGRVAGSPSGPQSKPSRWPSQA